MSKKIIEDTKTVKKQNAKKKKKGIVIATCAAFGVIAVGVCFWFIFVNQPDQYQEQKEEIKEVYEKVDVELSDNDFVVEDNQVEVVKSKKEEGQTKSSSALDQMNGYLTKQEFSGGANNTVTNTQEEKVENDDSSDSGTSGDSDIVLDDITKKINDQLSVVKDFMERSFSAKYYGEPLKQLIPDMKAGKTEEIFDYMPNCTNAKAFGILCTVVSSCAAENINNWTWSEDFILNSVKESNVFQKILLRGTEYNTYTVDVLVPDTSKTFNIAGHETTSSYLALCGNTSFYLDASGNILDIG